MVTWEQKQSLKTVWELQGFAVRYVHFEEVPDRKGKPRLIKVIGLEDRRKWKACPECGRRHYEWLFQADLPRRFRDCSLGEVPTFVEIMPFRVACCGGTRIEAFPWEAKGHRMTKRFFHRIAALCTRLPTLEVARMAHLSWDTVANVDKQATEMALGNRDALLDGLRWIGIDEVSRTGGHDYFTIVTDLETGRVVWIGDGKGDSVAARFFRLLGRRRRRAIRGVICDLGYMSVVERVLPRAIHVLDRFHIVQWLNDALNKTRRRLFGGAPKDEVGKAMKAKKWTLLSARENLERKHKLALATLMRTNRPLYRAYLLKEQLRGILHHSWRYLGPLARNLVEWCDCAVRSQVQEMKAVAKRLRPHLAKVIDGFLVPVKMGLVEAINGKIVAVRRQARGFRDREHHKLKIFQRCSLPENPWAVIVL